MTQIRIWSHSLFSLLLMNFGGLPQLLADTSSNKTFPESLREKWDSMGEDCVAFCQTQNELNLMKKEFSKYGGVIVKCEVTGHPLRDAPALQDIEQRCDDVCQKSCYKACDTRPFFQTSIWCPDPEYKTYFERHGELPTTTDSSSFSVSDVSSFFGQPGTLQFGLAITVLILAATGGAALIVCCIVAMFVKKEPGGSRSKVAPLSKASSEVAPGRPPPPHHHHGKKAREVVVPVSQTETSEGESSVGESAPIVKPPRPVPVPPSAIAPTGQDLGGYQIVPVSWGGQAEGLGPKPLIFILPGDLTSRGGATPILIPIPTRNQGGTLESEVPSTAETE